MYFALECLTRSFATLLRHLDKPYSTRTISHVSLSDSTSRLGLTIIVHPCLISVTGHRHPMSRTLHLACVTHTRARHWTTVILPPPSSLPPSPPPTPTPIPTSPLPPPITGAVIELASFVFCVAYLVCVLFCIERSATQPVSPQMFHASRKRERGRMDGGRSGVLQETPTARLQHDRVRCPYPAHRSKK